jgi:hypothetical protein
VSHCSFITDCSVTITGIVIFSKPGAGKYLPSIQQCEEIEERANGLTIFPGQFSCFPAFLYFKQIAEFYRAALSQNTAAAKD